VLGHVARDFLIPMLGTWLMPEVGSLDRIADTEEGREGDSPLTVILLLHSPFGLKPRTVSDKKDATRVFERFFTDNFLTVTATEPYSMCNR
jgi:hypothetical protein